MLWRCAAAGLQKAPESASLQACMHSEASGSEAEVETLLLTCPGWRDGGRRARRWWERRDWSRLHHCDTNQHVTPVCDPARASDLCGPKDLTCFLPDADPWTLQVGGLHKDGGGVESVGRKSVKAVLRQPGGDGDLMLSSAGGCRTEKTRKDQESAELL